MSVLELVATRITVAGTHEPFVSDVSFSAPAREVTVVPTMPGLPQTALALALGGRVELLSGTVSGSVTSGGAAGRAGLQARTRLVDVPDITAPEDSSSLRAVVAEELALADRHSSRSAVRDVLTERGLEGLAASRWDALPPGLRTRLLIELGSWHPGVRVVVVTGPDRHGGDPGEWLPMACTVAAAGRAVILLVTHATASLLEARLQVPAGVGSLA